MRSFEEQAAVGGGGEDDDVASLLGLGAPETRDGALHGLHGLGTSSEGQDAGIGFRGVVVGRKDDLIVNGGSGDGFGLIEDLGGQTLSGE
jgi:hypothetical protein